jgi:hypothetical protein
LTIENRTFKRGEVQVSVRAAEEEEDEIRILNPFRYQLLSLYEEMSRLSNGRWQFRALNL